LGFVSQGKEERKINCTSFGFRAYIKQSYSNNFIFRGSKDAILRSLVFTVFLSFAPIFGFFAPFLVYESSPLLNIILQLRILVLLLVSTLPYVVKVKNYS
jgi:hypothetical protein